MRAQAVHYPSYGLPPPPPHPGRRQPTPSSHTRAPNSDSIVFSNNICNLRAGENKRRNKIKKSLQKGTETEAFVLFFWQPVLLLNSAEKS